MDPAARALTERIGERLRAERNRHRLTLTDLSARTGLTKSRISNYEQGLRRPGIEPSCTLAAALESVTPDWPLCFDAAPAPLTDEENACPRSTPPRCVVTSPAVAPLGSHREPSTRKWA